MTNDEATKKIREAAAKGNIEFAPQDAIDAMASIADEVLAVIGHPEALITDWSSIDDFTITKEETAQMYERVNEDFGIETSQKTHRYIVDICRAIHIKRSAPGVQ